MIRGALESASRSEIALIVDEGPVGINLQSTRNKKGAFVESFYRAKDGARFAAERSGEIFVGDSISQIDNEIVIDYSLQKIQFMLLQTVRPLKLSFWRFKRIIPVEELILDSRSSEWIQDYLETYCLHSDADTFLLKIEYFRLETMRTLPFLPACRSRI